MTQDRIRITRKFRFDMAHALYGHDGPCASIHGHTYHLEVSILGCPMLDDSSPKNGMLLDFGNLKELVQREVVDSFDHALVLNGAAPYQNLDQLKKQFGKVILAPYQPTCENLVLEIKRRLQHHFDAHHQLISIKLEETPVSFAEWRKEDN